MGHIPKADSLREKISHENLDLACYLESQSTFAESFRFVRTATLLSDVDKRYPLLLVTSTAPREGKSTVAINIAITMAAAEEKVLLIDADLRNPRLHKVFQNKSSYGLTHVLSEITSPDKAISSTKIPNLHILPCGHIPPNPAELLGSERMRQFLNWTLEHFQRVIIDSPPVMAVADPLILANQVDGVIYTVQAGAHNCKAIGQSLQRIKDAHTKILGVVLNQVHAKKKGYYYYYSPYHAKHQKEKTASKQPSNSMKV